MLGRALEGGSSRKWVTVFVGEGEEGDNVHYLQAVKPRPGRESDGLDKRLRPPFCIRRRSRLAASLAPLGCLQILPR